MIITDVYYKYTQHRLDSFVLTPYQMAALCFFIILALTANNKNRYEKNTQNPASIFKEAVYG